MSKTAACIQMLQYLNTGRVYKISELASLVDTNARNIIEYKKELEYAGYYVISLPGRYGGYKLDKSALIPSIKLTDKEKSSLVESLNYILSKKDFVKKDILINVYSKIMSNISIDEKENNLMVVDKYQLSMEDEKIKERYEFLEKAIEQKNEIEIEYASLKSGEKKHVLHPYKLFIYNNSWFFLAWNPDVSDVWYFKVNRILKYKMLDKKFTVWKGFKAENYFDNQGLKQNGTYHHIELIASGTRAILMKERIYGKNQVTIDLGDGRVKVEMDMQNDGSIVSFVLAGGNEIEILEPQWLKDNIIEECSMILNKYKKEE